VQQGHDLLRARSRGCDDPDGSPPYGVRKAETRPPEHRGARSRAHDQQPLLRGSPLELDLVGEGNVVAEQQHAISVGIEALTRLELTGDRIVVWGDATQNEAKGRVATARLSRSGKVIDVSAPDVVTIR
jgi:hypothetical protein